MARFLRYWRRRACERRLVTRRSSTSVMRVTNRTATGRATTATSCSSDLHGVSRMVGKPATSDADHGCSVRTSLAVLHDLSRRFDRRTSCIPSLRRASMRSRRARGDGSSCHVREGSRSRRSRFRRSRSSGGLRRCWMLPMRSEPSAAGPSPNSTPSPKPSSSTCSATGCSDVRRWPSIALGDVCDVLDSRSATMSSTGRRRRASAGRTSELGLRIRADRSMTAEYVASRCATPAGRAPGTRGDVCSHRKNASSLSVRPTVSDRLGCAE